LSLRNVRASLSSEESKVVYRRVFRPARTLKKKKGEMISSKIVGVSRSERESQVVRHAGEREKVRKRKTTWAREERRETWSIQAKQDKKKERE
jgi:hypothetical protein